ncbi:MAG: hypothetical protein MZV64_49645 [Ignavibacteriales bacterium]|nr:hypothetical protein [Ignavibacteriales bacterium]
MNAPRDRGLDGDGLRPGREGPRPDEPQPSRRGRRRPGRRRSSATATTRRPDKPHAEILALAAGRPQGRRARRST